MHSSSDLHKLGCSSIIFAAAETLLREMQVPKKQTQDGTHGTRGVHNLYGHSPASIFFVENITKNDISKSEEMKYV